MVLDQIGFGSGCLRDQQLRTSEEDQPAAKRGESSREPARIHPGLLSIPGNERV